MPTIAAERQGGCLCGAVRYHLAAEPTEPGWCHCRTCQRNSGSPAMAFASVAPADFVFERGMEALRTVASSEGGERLFCGTCGTPLLMRASDGSGTWDFSLATLDRADDIRPGFHIYYDSHIPWAEAPEDGLPRYPKGRTA